MGITPGLLSAVPIVVTDADTAPVLGSGDVPVLATPRLLALAEAAAVAAIGPALEPGQTSVGTAAVIEHRQASPIGSQVVVEAELTRVDGRRLAFRFTARQPHSSRSPGNEAPVVAEGTMERTLVDRERFLSRLSHGA